MIRERQGITKVFYVKKYYLLLSFLTATQKYILVADLSLEWETFQSYHRHSINKLDLS